MSSQSSSSASSSSSSPSVSFPSSTDLSYNKSQSRNLNTMQLGQRRNFPPGNWPEIPLKINDQLIRDFVKLENASSVEVEPDQALQKMDQTEQAAAQLSPLEQSVDPNEIEETNKLDNIATATARQAQREHLVRRAIEITDLPVLPHPDELIK